MSQFVLRDTPFGANPLRDPLFRADPNGHGGNRRTAQIAELLQASGYVIADIYQPDDVPDGRMSDYFNGFRFLVQNNHSNILPLPRLIKLCGYHSRIFGDAIRHYPETRLLLWEATRTHIGVCVAKKAGLKVLALPHNLESLLRNQKDLLTRRSLPKSLEDELNRLRLSDMVFCIAREEQWLLKLFGIEADYLPYYPSQPVLTNLLKVRESRKTQVGDRFLIMGTAHNTATRSGMIEQIQMLNRINQTVDFEVDIVGYGTEQLKVHCDNPIYKLHGAVNSEMLHNLLAVTKAALLHQIAGGGALTRIPEMLIAGVPVIANSHACRSSFGYSGVYCYDSEHELATLISSKIATPEMLPRPLNAEKRFIQCIQTFTNW